MNSKFEKIAKKFKKIEFIWRQRGLSAQGACKFWWSNDVRGALEKKNKIVHFFQSFFELKFVFLHELLRCPNTTKMCTRLVHLSIFSFPKFHIFLNFFSTFSNLLFTCVQNLWFPLPRALRVSERHTNLHAPCGHDYLRSHKISDFFDLFCYFFLGGQSSLTRR